MSTIDWHEPEQAFRPFDFDHDAGFDQEVDAQTITEVKTVVVERYRFLPNPKCFSNLPFAPRLGASAGILGRTRAGKSAGCVASPLHERDRDIFLITLNKS